jgi:hypothetical protein
MQVIEAIINEANDEIIEVTIHGDEVEWQEIAEVLKDSDSDLATEIGMKISDAVENAGE